MSVSYIVPVQTQSHQVSLTVQHGAYTSPQTVHAPSANIGFLLIALFDFLKLFTNPYVPSNLPSSAIPQILSFTADCH